MNKDLQNLLKFTPIITGLKAMAKPNGEEKMYCDLGVPFDNLDLLGSASDYRIEQKLPMGTTTINALVLYTNTSLQENINASYDPNTGIIRGFTNNDPQTILIKIS